jgi:hypothetical protein
MADIPQLPPGAGQGGQEPDDLPIRDDDTGFYQILVLFLVFAALIAVIVVGGNLG